MIQTFRFKNGVLSFDEEKVDYFIFLWGKVKIVHLQYHFSCPQAGRALPFPIDEKEAKILSQRTLTRAL